MTGRRKRILSLMLFGLVLIVASLACGLGAAPEAAPSYAEEPAASEEPALPEPTKGVLLPTPSVPSVSQPQPAIPESRRLTLEFPPSMRTGDSIRIRLQLEVDDRGNITPTAVHIS